MLLAQRHAANCLSLRPLSLHKSRSPIHLHHTLLTSSASTSVRKTTPLRTHILHQTAWAVHRSIFVRQTTSLPFLTGPTTISNIAVLESQILLTPLLLLFCNFASIAEYFSSFVKKDIQRTKPSHCKNHVVQPYASEKGIAQAKETSWFSGILVVTRAVVATSR